MQPSLTVLIGRMSIFHNGHAELISRALEKSSHVLVLIGSSGLARNTKNPFTFEERKAVILDWYNGLNAHKYMGRLSVEPIHDHPYNDQAWIREVQAIVVSVMEEHGISEYPKYLTGADRDYSSWYLKSFGNFFNLDLVESSKAGFAMSATQLRARYFKDYMGHIHQLTPESTANFLEEFKQHPEYAVLVKEFEFIETYKASWKAAPYPPIFVTTDCCVIQSGHILLITRDAFPGRGLWALPGGFLEQEEKLIDGAIRELQEETSIGLSKAQLYGSIKDKEVFDNPGRSSRGRTITTCFLLQLSNIYALPTLKPQKGEVKKVAWVPISEALSETDKWFEDHHAIASTMISRIKD